MCLSPLPLSSNKLVFLPLKRYASATLGLSSIIGPDRVWSARGRMAIGIQILTTPKYWCKWTEQSPCVKLWLVKMLIIQPGSLKRRLAPWEKLVNLASSYQNPLFRWIIYRPSATKGCRALLRLINASTLGSTTLQSVRLKHQEWRHDTVRLLFARHQNWRYWTLGIDIIRQVTWRLFGPSVIWCQAMHSLKLPK